MGVVYVVYQQHTESVRGMIGLIARIAVVIGLALVSAGAAQWYNHLH